MKREILFRAKCIDKTSLKGKWLEGYILHDGVTGKYFIHMAGTGLNEDNYVEGLLQFIAYEIDPETICQHTGYMDQGKKKAFEHDIIFYEDANSHGYIVFEDGQFLIKWEESVASFRSDIDFWFTQRKIRITGNIFDNPELLGEAE